MRPAAGPLAAAYDACLSLAQRHYENFPVASRLVPGAMRPHVAAIYAFAREADDIADEPGYETADRYRLLDVRLARLHAAQRSMPDPTVDPVYAALSDTISRFALPLSLFEDLLSAFRQDVAITRYASWAAVDDYCRRSANPVGRLVLLLAGVRDEAAHRQSDAVCTALQLANFWQDFAIDWSRGRLYVPTEVMQAAGAHEDQLAGPLASLPPPWRHALQACTARTRELFAAGRPVSEVVRGRLRYELRATWQGGVRILEQLERSGFDPAARRPKLGRGDAAVIAWRALRP